MASFDVVCKLDHHEVDNAIDQAQREIVQRFDFKGTSTEVDKNEEGIVIRSNSEGRLAAGLDVLREKMVRRKVSLKSLDPQDPKQAGGSMWRQLVKLREGIDQDNAKKLVKLLKESKLKVQAAIQGDSVRISHKKKDALQEAITFLKEQELDLPLTYTNFRD